MNRYSTFGRRIVAGFVDGLVFVPMAFADGYLGAPERNRVTVLDVSEERIPTLRQAFLPDAGYVVLNCASLRRALPVAVLFRFPRRPGFDLHPVQ